MKKAKEPERLILPDFRLSNATNDATKQRFNGVGRLSNRADLYRRGIAPARKRFVNLLITGLRLAAVGLVMVGAVFIGFAAGMYGRPLVERFFEALRPQAGSLTDPRGLCR